MNKNKSFEELQKIEASTWVLSTPEARKEKIMREKLRYPMMIKQMNLHNLDTSEMIIFDIGSSPTKGVSGYLNCKKRICIDPNKQAYSKYYNVEDFWEDKAEDLKEKLGQADLIIATNCIDHFDNPQAFLKDLAKYMKYSAIFCHFHAYENAIQHVHEAHQINLTKDVFKEHLWNDFELVYESDFEKDGLVYGWLKEKSFCQMWRKVTDFK